MRTLLLALAACAAGSGCGRAPTVADVSTPYTPVSSAVALDVGDPFPVLRPEGWLNGPPPPTGDAGVKLVVMDVWAHWCPLCREGAPSLIRLHKKYAGRGVVFVSVTNMKEEYTKAFVDEFSIPWPSGYSLPTATLPELGASSGISMEGYAVAPVVYLLGPDGKIRWTDRQARLRHVKVEDWERDLDAVIGSALAAKP